MLFFFSAFATAKIDGISLRIDQTTIDRAFLALEPAMITAIKNMQIADVTQSVGLTQVFITKIRIQDINFIIRPRISFDDGLFCIRSAKVSTTLGFSIHTKIVTMFGSAVEAQISINNFVMCFKVDLDPHRKFVVTVANHQVVIDEMAVTLRDENNKVRTKMTGLLGLGNELIRSSINSFLDKDLSKNVEAAIAKQIDQTRPRAYVSPKEGVFMDFTPQHPPIFLDGITYTSRGYTFQEKDWAADFQHTQQMEQIPRFEDGFGVTCYMNDFVLRNLVGVLWAHTGLFERTFTERSDLIPLDFTVAGFSKIFQRLDEKYPKHLPTMLKVRLAQAPNIRIRKDYISVFVRADVVAMVLPENQEKPIIFGDFSVIAVVDAMISLEEIRTLKIVPRKSTRIDIDRFVLYDVIVDRQLINQTINGAIQLFINYFGFAHRTALDVIQKIISFESTKLKLADDLLVFAANLHFNEVPADFFSDKKGKKAEIVPEPFVTNEDLKEVVLRDSKAKDSLDDLDTTASTDSSSRKGKISLIIDEMDLYFRDKGFDPLSPTSPINKPRRAKTFDFKTGAEVEKAVSPVSGNFKPKDLDFQKEVVGNQEVENQEDTNRRISSLDRI